MNEKKFLDIPRVDHWESVPVFQKQMLGPLIVAFYDWAFQALRFQSTLKFNQDLYKYFLKDSELTVNSAMMRLKAHFKLDDPNLVSYFKGFSDDCPLITKPEELHAAVTSWAVLMSEHSWEEIIPRKPRIANLYHKGIHGSPNLLPFNLILNGQRYVRIFNHYYVPETYLNAKGAKVFFDYLAKKGRLTNLYDLDHKKSVTEELLRPVQAKLNDSQHVSLLDVGCGDGFVGDVATEMRILGENDNMYIYGVDISSAMFTDILNKNHYNGIAELNIARTSKKKLLELLKTEIVTDVILAFVDFWLSHQERLKTYKLIFKVLPKGGTLTLNVHHPNEILSPPDYKRILSVAGFSDITFTIKDITAKDGRRKVGFITAVK